MRGRTLPLMLGLPFMLAACAGTVPDLYTTPTAGFAAVSEQTSAAIGKRTAFAQTQAENEAIQREVRALVQGKTISADTAVQVALLNNKGLQASYAEIGLSAATAWQEATPVNPVVSIGVLGIGAAELGAYRAIESMIAANLLSATTRQQRMALADVNFRAAQARAVDDTLALANRTRAAWINAVAAFETVSYLQRAKVTSDGKRLFVALGPANRVAVVDAQSLEVLDYILVGQRVWQLDFTPDEKYLLTTNGNSNDITVIDVAREKAFKSVQVGQQPWGVVTIN